MVTSSCGTLAVGSDQPASDQGHSPSRSGDREGLRVVGRQPARRAGGRATGDRARVSSHRASAGSWGTSEECTACRREARSSESSSLPSVLPGPVRSGRCRDPGVLAHQPWRQPARVIAAAPNPPLEPTPKRRRGSAPSRPAAAAGCHDWNDDDRKGRKHQRTNTRKGGAAPVHRTTGRRGRSDCLGPVLLILRARRA